MSLLQLPGTSWVDKMICLGAPCFVFIVANLMRAEHLHDRWAPPWTYGQNLADPSADWSPKTATNFKQCKALFIFNWGHQRRHRLLQKRPPLSPSRIFHLIVLGAPSGSPILRFSVLCMLHSPFSVFRSLHRNKIWFQMKLFPIDMVLGSQISDYWLFIIVDMLWS